MIIDLIENDKLRTKQFNTTTTTFNSWLQQHTDKRTAINPECYEERDYKKTSAAMSK